MNRCVLLRRAASKNANNALSTTPLMQGGAIGKFPPRQPTTTTTIRAMAAQRNAPPPIWRDDEDLISGNNYLPGKSVNQYELCPLVVCGPSGVGTRSIIRDFLQQDDAYWRRHFASVLAHTTRTPRPGEVDGVDYAFVSHTEMNRLIFLDRFLEYSTVHGDIYGISFDTLYEMHSSKPTVPNPESPEVFSWENEAPPELIEIMNMDVQGVRQMKENQIKSAHLATRFPMRPKYIFIAPFDLMMLHERLLERGIEPANCADSLEEAKRGMRFGKSKRAFHAYIVNENHDETVELFTNAVKDIYRGKLEF